jgi:hypothetical protein
MHIEYRISEKDYRVAAQLAMRKRSTMSQLEYYGPYIFCVAWLFANVIPSPLNNYLSDPDLLLTLGVLPIVLGFLALRRKNIKREYAKLKNFHLLQVLDLDATGLRLVTTAGTSRSAWKVYSKFVEDKHSFVMFLAGSEAILPIPKNQLGLTDVDELRALMTARLAHEAKEAAANATK